MSLQLYISLFALFADLVNGFKHKKNLEAAAKVVDIAFNKQGRQKAHYWDPTYVSCEQIHFNQHVL